MATSLAHHPAGEEAHQLGDLRHLRRMAALYGRLDIA